MKVGKHKIKVRTYEFCESTTDEVFEVYHCTAQPLEWNLNSERKAWTEVVA